MLFVFKVFLFCIFTHTVTLLNNAKKNAIEARHWSLWSQMWNWSWSHSKKVSMLCFLLEVCSRKMLLSVSSPVSFCLFCMALNHTIDLLFFYSCSKRTLVESSESMCQLWSQPWTRDLAKNDDDQVVSSSSSRGEAVTVTLAIDDESVVHMYNKCQEERSPPLVFVITSLKLKLGPQLESASRSKYINSRKMLLISSRKIGIMCQLWDFEASWRLD